MGDMLLQPDDSIDARAAEIVKDGGGPFTFIF